MKTIFIALTSMFCISCQTGNTFHQRRNYVTNYKIVTAKGNFYVNDFILQRDSIHFEEFNRDGKSRGKYVFHVDQITVKE